MIRAIALSLAMLNAAPGFASAQAATAVQDIAIPFAPPTSATFTYSLEQQRDLHGVPCRFRATRSIRFDRADDGYVMTVTLDTVDADGPDAVTIPYRTALTPLIGVVTQFRMDADGRIESVNELDSIWHRLESGIAAMATTLPAGSDRQKAARSVQDLFARLSGQGRVALLAGDVQPILLFAGSSVRDGPARGLTTVAGSPLGRPVPVSGTLAVTGKEGADLMLEERLTGDGVAVAMNYRVSRTNGLVQWQRRSLTMGDRSLTEVRSLVPVK